MIIPKGSGLSFNHFKLTNLIFDWVDALPVGKVFTVFDLTEYIQTQPLSKYSKKGYRRNGKHMKTKISNRGSLSDSNTYFATILHSNCRDWNIRYGWLYANQHKIIHENVGKQHHLTHYLKTDDDGVFTCLFCEVNKTQMKPQWAYLGKRKEFNHKIILRDATCHTCRKLNMGIVEWAEKRRNKNENKKMD